MAPSPNYDSFLGYYGEFYTKILNYVYYRTGQDRTLAEDLTQEIFLKGLEKYSSYDPARPFQAWLYTIARNHLTDYYRKRREVVSYDSLENVLTTDDDLLAQIDQRDLIRRISRVLPQLTPEEQELVTLRYVQELSTEEICDILGKKPNAVYVALHRAIKKLRAILLTDDPAAPAPTPHD